MVVKMRPSTPQQAIVARELALLTAHAAFPPQVVHTPGIAHVVADLLSRIHDPKKESANVRSHPALLEATESFCPPRPRGWYRTLDMASPLRKGQELGDAVEE